ncbi:MAG: hypothetical protein LBL97_02145 [Prevotellaceae bacterium]|nr:hypothetical protein [Prevotellaceae bacterium]
MENSRKITEKERVLLSYLINKASLSLPYDWDETLRVLPLDDGSMGSLYLIPNFHTKNKEERSFGQQISECNFKDIDGIDVIASLNLDDIGDLFELDIWKVNFQPLIEIASEFHDVAT